MVKSRTLVYSVPEIPHGVGDSRGWVWPAVGSGLVVTGGVLVAARAARRWNQFDPGYRAVALMIGLVPAALAIALMLKLGRARHDGTGSVRPTAASVLAVIAAVLAELVALAAFGVS
jgi:hypothetical protein